MEWCGPPQVVDGSAPEIVEVRIPRPSVCVCVLVLTRK